MVKKIELVKPQIILFDWDDTLVDTGYLLKNLLHETLEEVGGISDVEKENVVKHCNHSMRDVFPKIFGDRWHEVREAYYKKIRDKHSHQTISVMPHALEAIKFFAEEGVLMSVVSNKNGSMLRDEIKKLEWDHYFHKVIGATDAARDKPWPEPVELALDGLMDVKNNSIWFVGDSIVDMQCALNTNCTPILFGKSEEAAKQANQLNIPHVRANDHKYFVSLYNDC